MTNSRLQAGVAAAEAAVEAVADRLGDPGRVPGAVSLGEGHPGVALLHARLGREDPARRPVTHAHLAAAVSRLGSPQPAAGLYYGVPALAFAVRSAVTVPQDYARLLPALDERVARHVRSVLARERARLAAGTAGPAMAAYDVIGGLAGIGRYLLACGAGQRELLREVLEYFVELCRPLRNGGRTVPGWWVPGPPSPAAADGYPRGHLNLGLAHGIPGPLALLALAHREGVVVPGTDDAMRHIVGWLRKHRLQDGGTASSWPACLDPEHGHGRDGVHAPRSRSAWCYGAPGVARALQLAGLALGEPGWQREAVDAVLAVLERPRREWELPDGMICHGTAGLLQVVTRMAQDGGDARLHAALGPLAGEVLAHRDPAREFVFSSLCGFLEGAAGTALALADHLAGPVTDGGLPWDAALLIA
ncbi:lanthionine synthetase C family protein [Streptoverticillium reticulum]|uniref:lanthionine synthetase C family protein n=1 Tax=Streptoverticillium reticulum TaxID=1433415 RepID=UPI0039BF3E5A